MFRLIQPLIESKLEQRRVVILIGQRQAGKTYLAKQFESLSDNYWFFDLEDESNRHLFSQASVYNLKKLISENQEVEGILVLDEVQYLKKSGSILKLIHDHFPQVKVLATGSASFLLLKDIGDSLYGRHISLTLLPLTFREMLEETEACVEIGEYQNPLNQSKVPLLARSVMLYGALPSVYLSTDRQDKIDLLSSYVDSLLFKDVFEIEGIRMPEVFKKLLRLLAFQIGNEVSFSELGQQLGIDKNTVSEYIGLYEKFQILYRLPAYSTNPRKEISKGVKVYFCDLGIRNALIGNFAELDFRQDVGGLFENLVMNVFVANIHYFRLEWEMYFWRSYAKSEVDLVLQNQRTHELLPIEIKFKKHKNPPKAFFNHYPEQTQKGFCINQDNLWNFI